MNQPTVEDIAALRAEGGLRDYLLHITGRSVTTAQPAPLAAAPDPGYRIAHTGGWPIGTAATGPTPTHGRCTCPLCEQAVVAQLPQPHPHQEGEAA